uniref:COesterase domain-containing protein n=1 Tax=Heterorhabditis bacteriophora TaxID=37862 RepID=A0A1I7XUS6_HETBA
MMYYYFLYILPLHFAQFIHEPTRPVDLWNPFGTTTIRTKSQVSIIYICLSYLHTGSKYLAALTFIFNISNVFLLILYSAFQYGASCAQDVENRPQLFVNDPYPFMVNEDCLYLNVFTPDVSKVSGEIYPVVVFFHGGNFQTGSASEWPAHGLASRGLVVVTVNYRLGALGEPIFLIVIFQMIVSICIPHIKYVSRYNRYLFLPNVDGKIIPGNPLWILNNAPTGISAVQSAVPLLIGMNANDGVEIILCCLLKWIVYERIGFADDVKESHNLFGIMAPKSKTVEKKSKVAKAIDAKKKVIRGQRSVHKKKIRTSVHFHRPKTLKTARVPRYPRKSAPARNRLDAFTIIKHPLTTESAMKKIEDNNTLVFIVDINANKHQIRSAVKKLYNIEVQKVNIFLVSSFHLFTGAILDGYRVHEKCRCKRKILEIFRKSTWKGGVLDSVVLRSISFQ